MGQGGMLSNGLARPGGQSRCERRATFGPLVGRRVRVSPVCCKRGWLGARLDQHPLRGAAFAHSLNRLPLIVPQGSLHASKDGPEIVPGRVLDADIAEHAGSDLCCR